MANLAGVALLSLALVVAVGAGRAVLGLIITTLLGAAPKPPLA